MYDVDVYTHSTLQFMYMYNARLFCCFLATNIFIVGNRTGVADYKIGQEANSKQSDVQVSLSTNRQTDRQAGRQAGRQTQLQYPSLCMCTD